MRIDLYDYGQINVADHTINSRFSDCDKNHLIALETSLTSLH